MVTFRQHERVDDSRWMGGEYCDSHVFVACSVHASTIGHALDPTDVAQSLTYSCGTDSQAYTLFRVLLTPYILFGDNPGLKLIGTWRSAKVDLVKHRPRYPRVACYSVV